MRMPDYATCYLAGAPTTINGENLTYHDLSTGRMYFSAAAISELTRQNITDGVYIAPDEWYHNKPCILAVATELKAAADKAVMHGAKFKHNKFGKVVKVELVTVPLRSHTVHFQAQKVFMYDKSLETVKKNVAFLAPNVVLV